MRVPGAFVVAFWLRYLWTPETGWSAGACPPSDSRYGQCDVCNSRRADLAEYVRQILEAP